MCVIHSSAKSIIRDSWQSLSSSHIRVPYPYPYQNYRYRSTHIRVRFSCHLSVFVAPHEISCGGSELSCSCR